jgi:glc operon protein GlcG
MRTKPSLTLEDANRAIAAAKIEAAKNQWPVAIAVVDDSGFLLHLERLDGASVATPEVATLKARTAAVSRAPTKTTEDMVKDRPAILSLPGRVPVQGGLPIFHQGECVGAIGVSGAKSHQDEQVAQAGVAAI